MLGAHNGGGLVPSSCYFFGFSGMCGLNDGFSAVIQEGFSESFLPGMEPPQPEAVEVRVADTG